MGLECYYALQAPFILFIASKIRRIRSVRLSSHRSVIHMPVAKFRHGRRRNLETIVRSPFTDKLVNYVMRRHDLRRGIYHVLKTEKVRVRGQRF